MNPTQANRATTIRVGLFSLFGLALIGAFTVFVNDKPYWWRKCSPVFITIEDATGLKPKSSIRSLGLQIGYLHSVELTETRVKIGVCITAPIEVLPETRAYIRGEGFLGDKFVELKPVHYAGTNRVGPRGDKPAPVVLPAPAASSSATVPGASTTNPSQTRLPADTSQTTTQSSRALRDLESKPVMMEKEKTNKEIQRELDKESADFKFPGVPSSLQSGSDLVNSSVNLMNSVIDLLIPSALAEDPVATKEIQVGTSNKDMDKLIEQSNKLMIEMTDLTKNLKEGLQPKELRETIQQLNKTLQAASKTLSPEGGLNSTARRALEKLEKAFEAMQQQMERINRGEGSIGRMLNDPVYADEALKAMKNLNKLLNKAADIQFIVKLGAEQLPAYDGGRGYFQLQVLPNPTRYYLIGITLDPRGALRIINTQTTAGGQTNSTVTQQVEQGAILLTGMLGKILLNNRIDFSAGALHGDGAVSIALNLGPRGYEHMFEIRNDVYVRGVGVGLNDRLIGVVRPFAYNDLMNNFYFSGGFESFRKINGDVPYLFGAGISFTDDDIKLLFAFK